MDLLTIGSANRYAKNMALKTRWNLKKQSGDFTGHKKSLGDYVNITKASSVLPRTDADDTKLSSIMTKAQSGRKLSPDDWEYLKTKNPVLYEKLRQAEKEQEAYEEALRRCKTKDEARRLHMSKLGDILTAAKNGDESALIRLNRVTRAMTEFVESEEYGDLPTEADEAIERESERKAKEEALRMEAEIKEAQREERKEADTESETVSDTDAAPSKPDTDAEARTVTDTGADAKAHAATDTGADAKTHTVTDTKPKFKAAKEVSRAKQTADAPPVLSVGQREYLNQRDSVSRNKSERKTFHARA